MTPPVEPMTHADAITTLATERYVLEEMSEAERDAFEAHYFSCPACAEDLRSVELMRAGTRDAAKSRRLLAFQPRQRRWTTVALPWAAAASLAVVIGYQNLVPSRLDSPYALEPVTLRPASRGGDAVVRLDADDRAVALAVEADAPAGAPTWLYELRTSQNRQVASGQAPVPASGAPLLLVVPSSVLTPSERYVLSLSVPGGAAPVVEYQFTVAVKTSNGAQ